MPENRTQGSSFFFIFFQNAYGAEGNDTAEIGGIFPGHYLILVDDAKGSLGVSADCVQLMAGPGTVKIKSAVFVQITDGDGIWIVVVSGKSQNAGCSFL